MGGGIVDNGRTIRLTVDAHLVDDCVLYSDLEVLVRLLDARGRELATRSLALPGTVFNRPAISSYRFDHGVSGAASVQGVIMNGRKRLLGGRPGPGRPEDDDPLVDAARNLNPQVERERQFYPAWHGFENADADFIETGSPRSDLVTCGSATAILSTSRAESGRACAAVREQAEERVRERRAKFGAPLTPRPEAVVP